MDKDIASLLALPWGTLIVLASGYAGYHVANAGLRDHHKTIDVAFSTLVFGFFGSFAYQLMTVYGASIIWASLAAFASAVLLGGVWNRLGRKLFENCLRITKVSHADGLPSAWKSIFSATDYDGRQLSVQLVDGTWLHCIDLSQFKNEPNGPCVLGDTGDILMYVTHEKKMDEKDFTAVDDLSSRGWGQEATYIPKERIARVDFRRSRKP